jgi:ubiquinone/menaquinone biosynthesis C-methylase UbiE
MLAAGLQPVGIDLSPYMARLTRKKLQKHGWQGAISQAQAQALPFADSSFANAIATFPTPYIFEPETLTEVYRVLANSPAAPGHLIIVIQGELQGRGPLKWVLDWLYQATGERDPLAPNPIALLAAAGFQARWVEGHFQMAKAQLIVAEKQGA